MAVRGGTLGHFGDARRATMGTTLVERVVETGSLVIRKLGGTRAREIAIHRFLSAPSVTCGEMVETVKSRSNATPFSRPIPTPL
ncbi:MAG TPA: transposase, partial [Acidiphilium sp.]|nr:transposase [Acidiphilium sp.]